jgi:hypothetical protein
MTKEKLMEPKVGYNFSIFLLKQLLKEKIGKTRGWETMNF